MRLRYETGLTGETVPASGLDIQDAWWPVIRSTSLAGPPPGDSITHTSEGTGADEGREFVGTFAGGSGRFDLHFPGACLAGAFGAGR